MRVFHCIVQFLNLLFADLRQTKSMLEQRNKELGKAQAELSLVHHEAIKKKIKHMLHRHLEGALHHSKSWAFRQWVQVYHVLVHEEKDAKNRTALLKRVKDAFIRRSLVSVNDKLNWAMKKWRYFIHHDVHNEHIRNRMKNEHVENDPLALEARTHARCLYLNYRKYRYWATYEECIVIIAEGCTIFYATCSPTQKNYRLFLRPRIRIRIYYRGRIRNTSLTIRCKYCAFRFFSGPPHTILKLFSFPANFFLIFFLSLSARKMRFKAGCPVTDRCNFLPFHFHFLYITLSPTP